MYDFEKEVSDEQDLSFEYLYKKFKEDKFPLDTDHFRSLGMINKDGLYTNLALLMSDQCPVEVRFISYDKDLNIKAKSVYKGSLIKNLDRVLNRITLHNDVSVVIDASSFKRIITFSYPGASLREGILNAFCHADYFIRSDIKIEFYDGRVKITNPGGIYKASLEEILSGTQICRNPDLMNILNKFGYIVNFGIGIPRILEAYNDSYRKPDFRPTENFFVLHLPDMNHSLNDQTYIRTRKAENRYIHERLSDFDLILLKTIYNNPGLRVPGLLKILSEDRSNVTEDRIKNSLKRNLRNLVEFKGAAKNGGYYLKDFK